MLNEINLKSDEVVLIKEEDAYHKGYSGKGTCNLILTNHRIICLEKGFWGKTKNIIDFYIAKIKLYNDIPYAIISPDNDEIDGSTMDVYFVNGQETFIFNEKSSAKKWINKIIKNVCGDNFIESSEKKT